MMKGAVVKKNSPVSSPAEKIELMLSLITGDDVNRFSGIYLDETLQEFFYLDNELSVPPIPVGELDYGTGIELTEKLTKIIPEYMYKHTLLQKRKPQSEQHSLQFVKKVPGKIVDFAHILRLDFKLSGGSGSITGKSDARTFPSYVTDRIKYKSRLVPVVKESDPSQVDALKIKSQLKVENSEKRITSVYFDEFSTSEISIDFSTKAGSGIFAIPAKIYQFISYDYFTACMNVPDPAEKNLERAAEIFEPLFFFLYHSYREELPLPDEGISTLWDDLLDVTPSGVEQKAKFGELLKKFFSRYTIYRDDDMMLKGLRKFVIDQR